jgi:hypothetical protein
LAPSIFEQDFVIGTIDTPLGKVPRVGPELSPSDRLGGCKVRWGIGRYDYTVVPGLYALGEPGADSPVLVTANYKLSFDALRRELGGIDAWLLPLNTNGINVWCAAGKRTFGTDTLIEALRNIDLSSLVNHRSLILPQLGAPGVAAHEVKRQTGFEVKWGPVRSADIPTFLHNHGKAEPGMRLMEFPLGQRTVLAPMELVPALKYGLPLGAALMILAGFLGGGFFVQAALGPGLFMAGALLWAAVAGSVAGPMLLPWLPGRAFSAKGAGLGLAVAALYLALWRAEPLLSWSGFFAIVAFCSFVLMNFTGSTTFTSLSGVKKEMRIAVPLQVAGMVLGLVLWLWALLS